jgi:hypothetical protein
MSVIQTGRPRRWLAAGLAATGLTLLAACGSSAEAAGATSATAGGSDSAATANADMEAFTSCLAKNGVTLPEPPAGGGRQGGAPPSGAPQGGQAPGGAQGAPPDGAGTPPAPQGVDEKTWNAALEACKDVRPAPPARS